MIILWFIFCITSCNLFIDSISQPDKIAQGQEFRIRLNGHIVGESRESGEDKAYLYLTIPKDWQIKGSYFTGSYSGYMHINEIDSVNHLPYYQYKLITTADYPYYPGAVFSLYIEIKAGRLKGRYNLTYQAGMEKYRDAKVGPISKPIELY